MSEPYHKPHHKPHHYVLISLRTAIIRNVKLEAVLQHMVKRKVVPKSQYFGKPKSKNGMNYLIGYLQNKSFDEFLGFVECILIAQGADPSKAQSVTIVDSIVNTLEEYDLENGTCWVDDVTEIRQRYVKEQPEVDGWLLSEDGQGGTNQLASLARANTKSTLQEDAGVGQDGASLASQLTQKAHEKFSSKGGELRFKKDGTSLASQLTWKAHKKFSSKGGELRFKKVSLTVPPLEGKELTLSLGVCSHGPFSISEKYLIASDFIVMVADNEVETPIEISMPHCLILPEHMKCAKVVILRADSHKVTEVDNLHTFERLTVPDVFPNSPRVAFECRELSSVLCVALERDSTPLNTHLEGNSSGSDHQSLGWSYFDSIQRTCNAESLPPPVNTVLPPSPRCQFDSLMCSILTHQSGTSAASIAIPKGRDASSQVAVPQPLERYYGIEYAALLVQPKEGALCQHRPHHLHHFAVSVFINCPVALEACMEQTRQLLAEAWKLAESESETKPALEPELEFTIHPFVWEAADIRLDYSVEAGCVAWTVEPWRTPTLLLEEVQFHTMNREDRIQQKNYPPAFLFTAEGDKGASPKFSCTVKLEGATMAETGGEVCLCIPPIPCRC